MAFLSEGLLPTYKLIDIGAIVVVVLLIIGIVRGLQTGRFDFPRIRALAVGGGDLVKSFMSVLIADVGTTRVLRTCKIPKWVSHVLIFWGFVFAGIATTLAYLIKPEGAVLPLGHPVKIFGNLGGILLLIGCIAMFFVRYQQSGSPWHLNPADFFLIVLFLTTVSGFAVQQSIYTLGRNAPITAATYWTHMGIIVVLFITAPFSKFIHALYKPSWILYERLERKKLTAEVRA